GSATQIASAQAALAGATAAYQAYQSQIANDYINNSDLLATGPGVVTEIDVTVGQISAPNAVLMVIQDESKLVVHAKIPVTYYGQIAPGQAAVIQPGSITNVNINGSIIAIV